MCFLLNIVYFLSLRDAILSPPEADSSFHWKEPWGLNRERDMQKQGCVTLSLFSPNPPGSFPWKELSASGGLRMDSAERLSAL